MGLQTQLRDKKKVSMKFLAGWTAKQIILPELAETPSCQLSAAMEACSISL